MVFAETLHLHEGGEGRQVSSHLAVKRSWSKWGKRSWCLAQGHNIRDFTETHWTCSSSHKVGTVFLVCHSGDPWENTCEAKLLESFLECSAERRPSRLRDILWQRQKAKMSNIVSVCCTFPSLKTAVGLRNTLFLCHMLLFQTPWVWLIQLYYNSVMEAGTRFHDLQEHTSILQTANSQWFFFWNQICILLDKVKTTWYQELVPHVLFPPLYIP